MSASGTTAKNWLGTGLTETRTTPATGVTRSASSATTVTLTTTSCSNTCAGTTTSATFAMLMDRRNTTGVEKVVFFLFFFFWYAYADRTFGSTLCALTSADRQRLPVPERALPSESLPVRGRPLCHRAVHTCVPHWDRLQGPQGCGTQQEPGRSSTEPPDRPPVQLCAEAAEEEWRLLHAAAQYSRQWSKLYNESGGGFESELNCFVYTS